jgi:hypothetical protein
MATFADYLDLRVAVAETVNNRNITDVLDRLTQQAESWLNQKLRMRQQITATTVTFTNGVAPLPAGYLEMSALYTSQSRPMEQTSLANIKRTGSQYSRYAVDSSNIYIYGVSDTRNIEYYAKLPTLTAGVSTSNWLLAAYPDVYLYAVSLEAAKFIRDADQTQAMAALLAQSMSDMKIDDDRALWGNATVRLGMCTP